MLCRGRRHRDTKTVHFSAYNNVVTERLPNYTVETPLQLLFTIYYVNILKQRITDIKLQCIRNLRLIVAESRMYEDIFSKKREEYSLHVKQTFFFLLIMMSTLLYTCFLLLSTTHASEAKKRERASSDVFKKYIKRRLIDFNQHYPDI